MRPLLYVYGASNGTLLLRSKPAHKGSPLIFIGRTHLSLRQTNGDELTIAEQEERFKSAWREEEMNARD